MVEAARQIAVLAIKADSQGERLKAVLLYMDAATLLLNYLKRYPSDKEFRWLAEQFVAYVDRARFLLNEYLKPRWL
jgi:hypothetical protein